jgi:flagellar biogenesis protein FliO
MKAEGRRQKAESKRRRSPNQLLPSAFCLLPFLLALSAMDAFAAPALSTNLPPVSLALPDAGFSIIRVFGALALVLALFLGGVWLFRNWQRLTIQRGREPQLRVLEMRALGNRHVLYVVGYQQQRLLLAASPAGVALVSHLPSGDEVETAPAPAAAPENVASPNFVQALQQAIQKKT